MSDNLPPLPEPHADGGAWMPLYTADQMHAYAAQAVAERDAEIAAEQRRSEMYTDLVRRTAEALGQPLWDGWHKLPERVEALRAQLQTDRDYRGQCQAQAADESARRRAAEAEVERLRRDCAEAERDAEIERLRAEVERLKTVPMKYRRMQFNAELQAEVGALRADAERYRWLRNNHVDSYPMGLDTPAEHGMYWTWQQATPEEASYSFEQALDAAIDRARGQA